MLDNPKILFFIDDCIPTEEEQLEAQGYGARVSFRNASFVPKPVFKKVTGEDGKTVKVLENANAVEKCDGVAGSVPELYADFPAAEDLMDKFETKRKELLAEAKKKAKAKKDADKKAKAEAEAAKAEAEKEAKAKDEEKKDVEPEDSKSEDGWASNK